MSNGIKLSNQKNYLCNDYQTEIINRTKNKHLYTGIKSIDEKLTIRDGVIMLGGNPSTGKSSILLQFIDNFAEQGQPVLFFSLEQVQCDLTAKSINRIQHKCGLSEQDAMERYSSFADKITMATSESAVTIESLSQIVKDIVESTDTKPIVFVDYLQLLHSQKSLSKREEIEEVSHQLVALSKKYGLTIFVISSLNRTNYLSPIDFESFKESGSLEYDADVVLGLQYKIVSEQSFVNCSSVDKKRLLIANEKTKPIRSVELTCIKNRFGPIFESCPMDYYADKDLFTDASENESHRKKNTRIL